MRFIKWFNSINLVIRFAIIGGLIGSIVVPLFALVILFDPFWIFSMTSVAKGFRAVSLFFTIIGIVVGIAVAVDSGEF